MTGTPLGGGGEFDRVRAIAAALGDDGRHLGDDCAFLPGGWCVSTDVSVDEVHFRRAWLDPEEIGWRATAAALSDLAAVGASAEAVLVAVVLPETDASDLLVALMQGSGGAAHLAGAQVVGGDLSRGAQLAVTVTVLGRSDHPVRRSGAQVGDGIWVTGALGGARGAFEAWRREREPAPTHRSRFARPEPRIAAGQWLAAHGASAMLDLSDGLAGDLGHLAAASGVALEVDLDGLPVDPSLGEIAGLCGEVPQLFAAVGGEDYELLVTLPLGFDAAGGLPDHLPLTRIGRVMAGSGVSLRLAGRPVRLDGFDHFR
ncbi:MAG: thiamine-phosphate kinase [Gemmatimonadales bacterium]|nr:thiamine-phosphate kinase [Gemmatimonadales bacterium]